MRKLHDISEVVQMIKAGRSLALSGDERALSQLPPGNWIGGTIPYFMNSERGEFSQSQIFVNEISSLAKSCKVVTYTAETIAAVVEDRFQDGYTLLILPAFQPIHATYAVNAPSYPNIYDAPIVGWVTGFDLESSDSPKTYDGRTKTAYTDRGVAFHVELPESKMGQIEIVNIHEEDSETPKLEFPSEGFRATEVIIDGQNQNLARYLQSEGVDGKAPLITDFAGAKINVCIKEINTDEGYVDFYAPVFSGRQYTLAKPIPDYQKAFVESVPALEQPEEFSCNCILNYLYGELESKKIGMTGPATFGEIAYILLNQTLVYMTIEDK